jgi:hypothetical protein
MHYIFFCDVAEKQGNQFLMQNVTAAPLHYSHRYLNKSSSKKKKNVSDQKVRLSVPVV